MNQLQNSVVHEYGILYSNRVVQRDKKWNDGKLKYYEFNNKLEVYNEDGNLIEVDFITEKFRLNLAEGNEFKLPNNRLVIEVDCKILSYTRDVSELFKKSEKGADQKRKQGGIIGITKIKREPGIIKQEKTNNTRVVKPVVHRPLRHKIKQEEPKPVQVKKEPTPVRPKVKQEPIVSPARIKQEPGISTKVPSTMKPFKNPTITPIECATIKKNPTIRNRKIPRIPIKSSRVFRYLSGNSRPAY